MSKEKTVLGLIELLLNSDCTKEVVTSKSLSPIQVGKKVFIRTVTHYFTGKIVELNDTEIILDKPAWIASTGRFSTALSTVELDEIEPYPGVVSVNRGSLIDCSEWKGDLPRDQK